MILMNRIKVHSFLSMNLKERYDLVDLVRKKRATALELARIKKSKGITKSAKRNLKKKGNYISVKQKAIKALLNLTPEQREKIMKLF